MSEERQKLLEQKRQRLLELKQRRSANANLINDVVKPTKQSIDVSTQTIPIIISNTPLKEEITSVVTPAIEEKQLNTYDVGIQTTTQVEEEPKVIEPQVQPEFINKLDISSTELNQSIIESIKLINKLQITKTIDLKEIKEKAKINTNFIESSFSFKFERPIASVDLIDSSVVVCFEKSFEYDHDAIVYHIEDENLIPTNYLSCIPAITTIQFDKFSKNKILGFSINDKFCIWELEPNTLIQNPTLITNSSFFTRPKNWFSHNDSIILIKQLKLDTNECILTLSKNFILNIWSMNLLSSPKYSFNLNQADELKKEKLQRIKDAMYVGNDELVGEITLNVFKLVILGINNKMYNETLSIIHEDPKSLLTVSMISLSQGYILTAHLDWTLKIWRKGDNEPFKEVNFSKKIIKLIERPNFEFQFITLSEYQNKYYIELWDLTKQLYSPIIKIIEQNEPIKFAQFNDPNKLVIAKTKEFFIYNINTDFKFVMDENTYDKGLFN
ncbi:hypothetical protein KGF54_000292 [Candida jiufengensis]|uniref:uncharacterized protein n=1 Tax=Candida jiufengensis TaxID=497108 RepID=UPI002225593C|nr:uncharacterized protein KGF54_000292 [Candida jiufengensis]KAI5957364.1 hypothetical protein KGF54_000292 [Candida jiufengensis]